jgi:hypothetical protein
MIPFEKNESGAWKNASEECFASVHVSFNMEKWRRDVFSNVKRGKYMSFSSFSVGKVWG